MKVGDALFVYGTLRPGETASLANHRSLLHIKEDRINGVLYHLGYYPGAVFDSGIFDATKPQIVGDVFLIRDASIIPILDAYEGYPDLYGRCQTYTKGGRFVWVYFYRGGEVEKMEPLKIGDWKLAKNANLSLNQELRT